MYSGASMQTSVAPLSGLKLVIDISDRTPATSCRASTKMVASNGCTCSALMEVPPIKERISFAKVCRLIHEKCIKDEDRKQFFFCFLSRQNRNVLFLAK